MRPTVLLVLRRATGGIRRHVGLLAPFLAQGPFRPVAAGAVDAAWAAELSAAGVAVAPCPPWRLPQLALRLRPAVVHAHGYRAAAWARLLPGARLVTAHNLPPWGLRAAGAPDGWLAVSHAVAGALAARGVAEDRIRVLPPCGADLRRARTAASRLRFGLPRDAEVVAYVGRLAADKGIEVLLAAYRLLRLARPAAYLLVVGSGPLEHRLRPLPGCRVVGRLDDPAPAYAAADVVAVPSRREGLGLVALEAQAAGRAVVAAATGGLPEVVGHGRTGWLVPPGDPETLAGALGRLLDDAPLRRRLAEAGLAAAAARSRAALVDAVLRAYGAAVDGGGSERCREAPREEGTPTS